MTPGLINLCMLFFAIISLIIIFSFCEILERLPYPISDLLLVCVTAPAAIITFILCLSLAYTPVLSVNGRYKISNKNRIDYTDSYQLIADKDGNFIDLKYKRNSLLFPHRIITKADLCDFYLVDLQDKTFIFVNDDYTIEKNTFTENPSPVSGKTNKTTGIYYASDGRYKISNRVTVTVTDGVLKNLLNKNPIDYADFYQLFTDKDGNFIALEYRSNCFMFPHRIITRKTLHNFYLVDLQDKSFITVNSDYAIEENTITEYQVTDYERG